jgi:glycosyltransferase involved in cell wall biosynthesis
VAVATSILVPYRAGEAWRDRAWTFNRARWEAMPDVEVVVCDPGPGRHPGEFNHPRAINDAARRASGDVFIVADADTAFHPDWVAEAVREVRLGAPWVLPRFYDKVDQPSTERILAGGGLDGYTVEWRGEAVSWSGLVVVPAAGFQVVGGYDERWEWWGADDVAFAMSMLTLWGEVVRLEGAAMHLWHPTPIDETYGHDHFPASRRLMERYVAANADRRAMLRLIAERP